MITNEQEWRALLQLLETPPRAPEWLRNAVALNGTPSKEKSMTDKLGDRCKRFEMMDNARLAMPGIPLLARLDGKAFHTFTREMKRPYDLTFMNVIVETASHLVKNMHAKVAYTQSDEITLLWWVDPSTNAQFPFDGRFQKLTSVLAGMASAFFARNIGEWGQHDYPCFDCRVWQVPTREDALDVFVWREDDATKNSVSMAAQSVYSHKELHGKHSGQQQDMLLERGINWNDYYPGFKRGNYLQRKTRERTFTDEEWLAIPEKHRPARDKTILRSSVELIEMPPMRKVKNALDVLFDGADPISDWDVKEEYERCTK